jgi:hypothetical protein
MGCKEFDKFGILYLYNELNEKDRSMFQKHIKNCDSCKKNIKEMEKTLKLYEDIPDSYPSSAVVERIIVRVKKRRSWKMALIRPILVGAGCILLVFIGSHLFHHIPEDIYAWQNGVEESLNSIDKEIYSLKERDYISLVNNIDGVEYNIENLSRDAKKGGD